MVDLGLLRKDEDLRVVKRPDVLTVEYTYLKVIGQIVGKTAQRYAIYSSLLFRYRNEGILAFDEFKEECQLLSKRLGILSGIKEPDLFDEHLFSSFVEQLQKKEHISIDNNVVHIHESLRQVAAKAMEILSVDVRQSIQRTTASLTSKEK